MNVFCVTLREESNAEKSPEDQKNAELKSVNLVQNSHSFIPHFLNRSHHSHPLIPDHSDLNFGSFAIFYSTLSKF